jgi:hypothetical protein
LRRNKKILSLLYGGIKKNYSSIKEIFKKKLKKFVEE